MGDSNNPLAAAPTASTPASRAVTSWDLTEPLPKLPIPELKSTLEKYLSLMSTVVSPEELAITKKNVEEFTMPGGWGEKIQNRLLQRREDTDNWAYDYWLDDMYMRIRLPLPINSNPGMVFPRQRFFSQHDHLSWTSKFICGLMDYKKMIDTGSIPIERCRAMEKGQPLCMEQHYRMFSSYRRPGIPRDEQLTTLGRNMPPHIAVACNGKFYKVELEQDGQRLSESELHSQLSLVMSAAETDIERTHTVGVLTSLNRSKWAEARNRLKQNAQNTSNLEAIENALFVLCLDKPSIASPIVPEAETNGLLDSAHQMLHGQGSKVNTGNRWFDTVQFITTEDGVCGMNYEHSVAEGIALVQLVEHALSYVERSGTSISNQQETRDLRQPIRLRWNITSETLNDIEHAAEEIDRLIENLDLCFLRFEDYGSNFPKSQGVSPDAFIQLALQMTYYKLHKTLATTYESASIRRFRKGRVDVIRANSPAALAWIRATLGETEATVEEKFKLFMEAAEWQQNYQVETVLGRGIDCHLLGLREAASEMHGLDSLPFFKDPSFSKANYFKLSTSQVGTGSDSFMFYGPVVPDGYGACYNPFPNHIIFIVSTFSKCPDTDSQMFIFSLESTLLQMRELCLQGKEATENKARETTAS